jgi:hypothetical protein
MHLLAVVFTLTTAAPPAPIQASSTHVAVERTRLTAEDLRVWPSVDASDPKNNEAIACLRRFFEKKLDSDATNDYWLQEDLESYVHPYADLIAVEFDSEGRLKYWPTLMRCIPVGATDRMLTVKWAAVDNSGTAADVRYVYEFLAHDTADGMRLSVPLDHNTREWKRSNVGPLHYIVSPLIRFSQAEAEEQADTVYRLSNYFGIPEFPITYYAFLDPQDLFRAQGFHAHPLMYAHATGGRVDHGEHVLAGNNSALYTHEIVHLFEKRKFGSAQPNLLAEGLATLLGGSGELPYSWHRNVLKEYLAAQPTDLNEHLDPYVQHYIQEHTNMTYALGAVLCEHILRTAGKDTLFHAMTAGPELWPALEMIGVKQEDLDTIITEELERSPLRVW